MPSAVLNHRPPPDEVSSLEDMPEEEQPITAETSGEPPVADPEPLPGDVSSRRLRRGLLRLGGLLAIAVVVVTLGPGLGELRSRFAHAQPAWILIACAFEVLSVLAYVPAFRAVFCTRMSWATSYKIAVAEEGAGSLFPLGGAGSLALGVWALRRGGMPADEIARKTVAFFLLTSAAPVAMLFLLGAGLATGILPGGGGVLLTVLPAVLAAGAIAATLALRRLARGAEARLRRPGCGVAMGPDRTGAVSHGRRHRRGATPTQARAPAPARRARGVLGLRHAHFLGELPGGGSLAGAGPDLDGLPDRPAR